MYTLTDFNIPDSINIYHKGNVSKMTDFDVFPLFVVCFFFDLGFTARQDYFIHFEPSQSIGGAKKGDPREKPT